MFHGRRPLLAILLLLGAGIGAITMARADDLDIPGLFDSAKTAYAEKHYGKALGEIKLLAGEIGRLRLEQLQATMPAAPAGWTAQEAAQADSTAAMALFGGGVSVQREYTKGEEGRIQVQLVADNPMVAMLSGMLQNPQFLPPNTKIVTVKGRKALLESEPANKRASLKFMLNANTALLTVDGNGVEKADVDAFGNALDLDKMEKALQD